MRRNRLQKGSITLRGNRWFTRYRTGADRRMVSEFLAVKDDVHHSAKCAALRRLNQAVMAKVNSEVPERDESPTVERFYADQFFPWVEANKKESTARSYRQCWNRDLKGHFNGTRLLDYRTSDASKFLTSLAERGLGRNAIAAVRSLMSNIFSYAVNLGLIERNPLNEARILAKVKPPKKAEKYSLREVEDMVSALVDRPDLQLGVMLMGFLGMRPSEASALGWDCVNIESGEIWIRRGLVHNRVVDVKTPGSENSLPMIGPVKMLLSRLARAGTRKWVFESRRGTPLDMGEMAKQFIRPAIEKWNAAHGEERRIEWKGLYALRRTAASTLWKITGRTEASQQLLRHTNPLTVNRHYLVAERSEMLDGLKRLEERLANGGD